MLCGLAEGDYQREIMTTYILLGQYVNWSRNGPPIRVRSSGLGSNEAQPHPCSILIPYRGLGCQVPGTWSWHITCTRLEPHSLLMLGALRCHRLGLACRKA